MWIHIRCFCRREKYVSNRESKFCLMRCIVGRNLQQKKFCAISSSNFLADHSGNTNDDDRDVTTPKPGFSMTKTFWTDFVARVPMMKVFLSIWTMVATTTHMLHMFQLKDGWREYFLTLKGMQNCGADLLFNWFGFVRICYWFKISKAAKSKQVKQDVNCTVILPIMK